MRNRIAWALGILGVYEQGSPEPRTRGGPTAAANSVVPARSSSPKTPPDWRRQRLGQGALGGQDRLGRNLVRSGRTYLGPATMAVGACDVPTAIAAYSSLTSTPSS